MEPIVKPNSLILFAASSRSGKSHLIKHLLMDMLSTKQVKFGLVFCATKFNGSYDFIEDKYVIGGYNEQTLRQYIEKLKEFQSKNGYFPNNFLVFDDLIGLIKNTPYLDNILSTYRHYNITLFVTTQYINKISPLFREQATYCFMFKQHTKRSIEALFESYGQQMFDKYVEWKKYLDAFTPQYHALMYDSTKDSMDERFIVYKAPAKFRNVTFSF